jgi:hypothetical protein
MDTLKNAAALVLAVLLVIGLCFGGYQLYWAVAKDSTDKRTQVNDQSQGRQQALTTRVLRDIETVREIDDREDDGTSSARREALVESICINAGQLTGSVTIPPSASQFIAVECP